MDATLKTGSIAGRLSGVQGANVVLLGYAGTLFLSALLLFSVQPMFAKMVLPQLGGSPSVWAVSTCFFQAMLLAGYCYAHVLNRYIDGRLAPLVHLIVMGLAFLALPIALPAGAGDPPEGGAYLWLIGMLAAGVGLPFFAVSANAPLLQAWFSRTGNPHAADPYFLYGASNLGSLLALLSYPIVIEPMLGLGAQASVWSIGFLVLAMAVAASGLMMVSLAGGTPGAYSVPRRTATGAKPSMIQKARWVLYALVPSGLLVAFTTHLSTDIAAAPFLWVVPLALFLLTFVLVFRETPLVSKGLMLKLQPAVIAVALTCLISPVFGWWQSSLAAFLGFLVTTLVAHQALYDDRPDAEYLTEFYLWMSFGGVLGGMFAAILAPQIFNSTYEFPLLLTLGMICRPGVFAKASELETRYIQYGGVLTVTALAAGLLLAYAAPQQPTEIFSLYLFAMALIPLYMYRAMPRLQVAISVAMTAIVIVLPSLVNRGHPTRSFFGVLRVLESDNGKLRRFMHGTTSHGAQRLVDKDGKAIMPPIPATYYHPKSAMAEAVGVARIVSGKAAQDFRAGIIGLGIGSMACYSKPEENWRFYEIDAAVLAIAADPKKFNFLSACRPGADVVLGDARLTIAKEPAGKFDYLQVDAFSSDAVPVHMLTVESMRLYLDKLAPTGVLAFHVSNRHLDLAPVAAAAAISVAGTNVAIVRSFPEKTSFESSPSVVVIVTKNPASFAPFAAWPDATVQNGASVKPWTDDFSNVISALWRAKTAAK